MSCLRHILRAYAIVAGSRPSLRGWEESPDYIEQGFLLLKKDTADYMPREGQCNRKYTAWKQVRVKG